MTDEGAAGSVRSLGAPGRIPILARITLLAWAAVVAIGAWGFSYDDAFITYRYARSWEERVALEFNPGETAYGTTAPGYAVLLGTLARVAPGIEVPEWGTLLGVGSLVVLALLTGAAAPGRRKEDVVPAALVPVAVGAVALTLRWNVELFGAEAFPAAALVGLGAWQLFGRSREATAGLLLAAAAMLRLDAGLAACALGLAWWIHRRRFPVRLALAGALPLAVYAAALVATFGRLVPPTLDVKQSETVLAAQTGHGTYTAAQWGWLLRGLPVAGAFLLLVLGAAGVVWLGRRGLLRHPLVLALGAWIVGHEVFYRAVGVPFAPWYSIYTLAAVVALAVFGVRWAAVSAPAALGVRRPAGRIAGAVVVSAALLAPILVPSAGWMAGRWGEPPDPRWDLYHRVGRWLASEAPSEEDAMVASVEVGFVGYSSRRPVLDLLGLVSPGVLEARREERLPEYVAGRAPRYILDVPWLRGHGLGAVLEHPPIARSYAPVARFEAGEGRVVRLLERRAVRDGPATP